MTPILGILASGISGNLWQPGKDYDSIATVSVGAGGSSTISFTSIPGTYRHLQIRYTARSSAASAILNLNMTHNSDTGANYAWHRVFGNGLSASAGGSASQSLEIIAQTSGASVSANIFGTGVIDILDYANTSKYKTSRTLGGIEDNSGTTNSSIQLFSGLWQNTAAVSTIAFTLNSGDFAQYSQFALYGVK
jgi:hypothetical protein